jgi:hypothetical protein
MKLPAVPVNDLTDVTLNFEALQRLPANGSSTGIFPGASVTTTPKVVGHSLKTVPSNVQVTSTSPNVHFAVTASSSTSITVTGETLDGSTPAAATAIPFFWLAYG